MIEQSFFLTQFDVLRAGAESRGIQLMGDLPLYVASIPLTSGRLARCSSSTPPAGRSSKPARRPTISGPPVNCRAIPFTIGRRWRAPGSLGGSGACATHSRNSISCASTTSASSKRAGKRPATTQRRSTVSSRRRRVTHFSRRSPPRSVSFRSSPKTSDSSPLKWKRSWLGMPFRG
jgi:hypothetical protein